MTFTPTFIAHTRIKLDRVAEFESWVQSEADLKGLPGRWQLMRTDEQRDGAAVFLILFEGGDEPESWDMETALQGKYGAEGARAEVARFEAMLDGDQQMWRLTPVP
jgi:hypothetical protein